MPMGITILCYGVIVYYLLDYFIAIYYTKKVIQGLGYGTQLSCIILPLILSFLSGIVVLLVIQLFEPYLLKIICGLIFGLLSYIIIGYSLRINEFCLLINMMKKITK